MRSQPLVSAATRRRSRSVRSARPRDFATDQAVIVLIRRHAATRHRGRRQQPVRLEPAFLHPRRSRPTVELARRRGEQFVDRYLLEDGVRAVATAPTAPQRSSRPVCPWRRASRTPPAKIRHRQPPLPPRSGPGGAGNRRDRASRDRDGKRSRLLFRRERRQDAASGSATIFGGRETCGGRVEGKNQK